MPHPKPSAAAGAVLIRCDYRTASTAIGRRSTTTSTRCSWLIPSSAATTITRAFGRVLRAAPTASVLSTTSCALSLCLVAVTAAACSSSPGQPSSTDCPHVATSKGDAWMCATIDGVPWTATTVTCTYIGECQSPRTCISNVLLCSGQDTSTPSTLTTTLEFDIEGFFPGRSNGSFNVPIPAYAFMDIGSDHWCSIASCLPSASGTVGSIQLLTSTPPFASGTFSFQVGAPLGTTAGSIHTVRSGVFGAPY